MKRSVSPDKPDSGAAYVSVRRVSGDDDRHCAAASTHPGKLAFANPFLPFDASPSHREYRGGAMDEGEWVELVEGVGGAGDGTESKSTVWEAVFNFTNSIVGGITAGNGQ